MGNHKNIIIITGPTGVGKTDFVLKLAESLSAEIINADIGQMYEPLSIGTAKPDWKNEPIPHHLFDIITEPKNFSVVKYRKKAIELVNQIWDKGKTPIIVGGSTLYVKSLFFPPDNQEFKTEASFNDNKKNDGWTELNQIDPKRAAQLHQNDTYRINRALDIWYTRGIKPSDLTPKYNPIADDFKFFILNAPKEKLYTRTDARVNLMMDMGWVKETAVLNPEWRSFLRQKKIIGYEVILDYLDNKMSYQECIVEIQKRVRNYAKKQQTFWRGFKKQLVQQDEILQGNVFELDLTLLDVDLYIKQLLSSVEAK